MATQLTFTPFCFFILWIANRFCFALGLFCNRLQKTREPRQNFGKTLGYASCATLSIWPHFDARQRGIYLLDLSSHLISPALCIITSFPFLLSRVSLVNFAIVAYFIEDLQINRHFDLVRKLLFMEDGEFSLSLSNQLFDKGLFCPLFPSGKK